MYYFIDREDLLKPRFTLARVISHNSGFTKTGNLGK